MIKEAATAPTFQGQMQPLRILNGDALAQLAILPDESVQCCVTSPPYWGLRDYGHEGQLGLEKTPEEYVAKMVAIFREVRRVLKDDGTLWMNLGDSYAGSCQTGGTNSISGNGKSQPHAIHKRETGLKSKDLVGIPWMVAFALRADGWYLRSDIIWHKPNPMPESVTDRPTKSHEYLFLLSKNQRYFYDSEAIAEPVAVSSVARLNQDIDGQLGSFRANGGAKTNGAMKAVIKRPNNNRNDLGVSNIGGDERLDRNKRTVWTVIATGYSDAHFATYPPNLIKPCILAGSKSGDTILDPFGGSGTTGMVALELGRNAVLIELNPEYCKLIERRCDVTLGLALSSVPKGKEKQTMPLITLIRTAFTRCFGLYTVKRRRRSQGTYEYSVSRRAL